MATISFLNLDQPFGVRDNDAVIFSAANATQGPFEYSYLTTGGDDWEFDGTGVTIAGGVMTGGSINNIQLDLDNDAGSSPEIVISGLEGVAATSFGIGGAGTDEQQRNQFWAAALGGVDSFDFTMADYSVNMEIAGDGANLDDGLTHVGADDSFDDGGTAAIGAFIRGDYLFVYSGSVTGGNDSFTVGAASISGDFQQVEGGSVTGGDDVIAPERLASESVAYVEMIGDAVALSVSLTGGDDLIDLQATDVADLNSGILLVGDVWFINPGASLDAGDDIIDGSSRADEIYGDWLQNNGTSAGGNDSLSGHGGADTISGNEGLDTLFGGAADDSLDGGAGDDTIAGEAGRDIMMGAGGVDTLHGFGSHDTLLGGNGDDDLRGGFGRDLLNGSGNNDVIRGFEGEDRLFGGGGDDTLLGNDENDSLIGGGGVDRLKGDAGDDSLNGSFGADTSTGGLGDDEFQFRKTHGADAIDDFVAGAATDDVIRLIAFGAAFDTFAEVMAAATQIGADVVIDFGGGDTLTLEGVTLGSLHADDFMFG